MAMYTPNPSPASAKVYANTMIAAWYQTKWLALATRIMMAPIGIKKAKAKPMQVACAITQLLLVGSFSIFWARDVVAGQ